MYCILDNVSFHCSKKVERWLAKQEGSIEFVYLPKNAAWLNLIERVFLDIQRDVIDNSDFGSGKELGKALKSYGNYFMEQLKGKWDRKYQIKNLRIRMAS